MRRILIAFAMSVLFAVPSMAQTVTVSSVTGTGPMSVLGKCLPSLPVTHKFSVAYVATGLVTTITARVYGAVTFINPSGAPSGAFERFENSDEVGELHKTYTDVVTVGRPWDACSSLGHVYPWPGYTPKTKININLTVSQVVLGTTYSDSDHKDSNEVSTSTTLDHNP